MAGPTNKGYSPSFLRDLATQFKMVSDPTRVRLLGLLGEDQTYVGAIAGALRVSPAVVSRHLSQLREAGFVEVRRDGNFSFYSLTGIGRKFRDALEKRCF